MSIHSSTSIWRENSTYVDILLLAQERNLDTISLNHYAL